MPGTWLKPYEGKGALRGFLVSRLVFTHCGRGWPFAASLGGHRTGCGGWWPLVQCYTPRMSGSRAGALPCHQAAAGAVGGSSLRENPRSALCCCPLLCPRWVVLPLLLLRFTSGAGVLFGLLSLVPLLGWCRILEDSGSSCPSGTRSPVAVFLDLGS